MSEGKSPSQSPVCELVPALPQGELRNERVREPKTIDQPAHEIAAGLAGFIIWVYERSPDRARQGTHEYRPACARNSCRPCQPYNMGSANNPQNRARQGTHEYRPAEHALPPGAAWLPCRFEREIFHIVKITSRIPENVFCQKIKKVRNQPFFPGIFVKIKGVS